MSPSNSVRRFEIEPRNRFFAAVCSITGYEIRHPGNTVSFFSEVDLSEIEHVRDSAGQAKRVKPTYTAFVVKAVALALGEFPYANRRIFSFPMFGPRVQKFTHIDAAVLCEREESEAPMVAFVDMIRDADQASLESITARLSDLATCDATTNEQWRSFSTIIKRLPSCVARWVIRLPVRVPRLWVRYRGGAFVVSSPAKYGVDTIAASWPWPLGVSFGLVRPRPVIRDNQVVPRPTFVLTLNFDRRLMAGAQAARFFKRITQNLETAETTMTPFLESAFNGDARAENLS